MKKIKILTITLLGILLAVVAFGGIYFNSITKMVNIVKPYSFTSELSGNRLVSYSVTEETLDEAKTAENFLKTKEIIEERLEKLEVPSYKIAVNTVSGKIDLDLIENENTNDYVSNVYQTGKFEMIDTNTQEVFFTNDDIKEVNVMAGLVSETSSAQGVSIEIQFNDDVVGKLEEISTTYVEAEEEEEEESTEEVTEEVVEEDNGEIELDVQDEEVLEKTVTLNLSGSEVMTTTFGETITDGAIYLTVGTAYTEEEFTEYIIQAINVKTALDTGVLPVELVISNNQYVESALDGETIVNIVTLTIMIVSAAIYIVKYKSNGILAAIITVITMSLILIVLRYANVNISLIGIAGLVISAILNALITMNILKSKDNEEVNAVVIKTIVNIIPLFIITLSFIFTSKIEIVSMGMVMFWGTVIVLLTNYVITKTIINTK